MYSVFTFDSYSVVEKRLVHVVKKPTVRSNKLSDSLTAQFYTSLNRGKPGIKSC